MSCHSEFGWLWYPGKDPRPSSGSTGTTERVTLHLNAFRGEPAISAFDWHFTPTHSSSKPFSTDTSSGVHLGVTQASPWPWVDHAVSGLLLAICRTIRTRFRSGSAPEGLNRTTNSNSPVHSAKGTPSSRMTSGLWLFVGALVSGSISLPSRGSFHLSLTVLVHYRWQSVFSLRRWSSQIPARLLVSRGTWGHSHAVLPDPTGLSPSVAGLSRPVRASENGRVLWKPHNPEWACPLGLGCSPFARRY